MVHNLCPIAHSQARMCFVLWSISEIYLLGLNIVFLCSFPKLTFFNLVEKRTCVRSHDATLIRVLKTGKERDQEEVYVCPLPYPPKKFNGFARFTEMGLSRSGGD